jgi:hypothetical protein
MRISYKGIIKEAEIKHLKNTVDNLKNSAILLMEKQK